MKKYHFKQFMVSWISVFKANTVNVLQFKVLIAFEQQVMFFLLSQMCCVFLCNIFTTDNSHRW